MQGRPIEKLIYEQLFPKAKPSDPQTFANFLTCNLIPEVRLETQAFYGHLDTQEAKYPGLDYNHPTHRIRLTRWPWHRRFLRAIDALSLTHGEVASLTRWEGTKWAKEKFESEHGVVIKDTTRDGIPDWDDSLNGVVESPLLSHSRRVEIRDESDEEDVNDEDENDLEDKDDENMNEDGSENQSETDMYESIGVDLNERLRAGAARRAAGDTSAVLDEEWEQWLKNAIETGILRADMSERTFRDLLGSSRVPRNIIPPTMLSAARAGQWSEIPELAHPFIRAAMHNEDAIMVGNYISGRTNVRPPGYGGTSRSTHATVPPATASTAASALPTATSAISSRLMANTRRTYSDLRLPVGGRSSTAPGAS